MEFGVGAILDGKVTGITKFGAFIALPEGKSGLVHISEIAHTYVSEVSEHLTEGQEVKVKVIGIDQSNRVNLSIKQATEPPKNQGNNDRPRNFGGDRPRNFSGDRPRQNTHNARPNTFVRPAPKEPTDFEDRLKQFMQTSDSKQAEMRHLEKKGSRRGRK